MIEAFGRRVGLRKAAMTPMHPNASPDISKDRRVPIVDLTTTQIVDGDLVRILGWQDNDWGYAARMVRAARGPFDAG